MKAWENLLASLEWTLGSDAIESWLRPIKIVRFDAANLYLRATPFQKTWFDEHVRPLNPSLLNNNERPIRIHWETDNPALTKQKTEAPSYQIRPDHLESEYSLDTYLPLSMNEMGLNMAQELCKGEPSSFNPVFYFGPTGSGKTHLLMAIAQALQKKNQSVFYVKAQTFMEHVVNAIRLGLMKEFRKTYRDIDALIVDDVHQLARKNATQEEFFHTFNTLHTLGKQIILSAECSPAFLQEIEPRLISRFEWGIAIGLSAPDATKRVSILKQKAQQLDLELPSELYPYLVENFPSSPKAAIQAIHSLALRTTKVRDQHHADQLLTDLLKKESADALTSEKIIKQIATYFGIRAEDLTGKSQMREFAQPRQIAMYFCRKLLRIPFQGIGRLFGRDHSTVMSSIKQVDKAVEAKEPPYAQSIEAISRKFLMRLPK